MKQILRDDNPVQIDGNHGKFIGKEPKCHGAHKDDLLGWTDNRL